jgi:DNA-binding transcriptional MerR regulator
MTADMPLSGHLDDDDYPAYTMGRAAEMLGTTPGFLRAIGEARLITPLRSEGGHRRYSRYQLRIAARARELVDQGTPVEAACRIVILEDQLEDAQRINAEYRRASDASQDATAGASTGAATAGATAGASRDGADSSA